jgi:hypothetical protein
VHKSLRYLFIALILLIPGITRAGDSASPFDGNWLTRLTCPAKGSTEGYTWEFPSTITNGSYHGERGTAGEPGYFQLDGKIGKDGKAKLSAAGIVASREYARGVFAHKGADYSYDVKAEFKERTGTGLRNQGMGIEGRPCTFEFTKQAASETK